MVGSFPLALGSVDILSIAVRPLRRLDVDQEARTGRRTWPGRQVHGQSPRWRRAGACLSRLGRSGCRTRPLRRDLKPVDDEMTNIRSCRNPRVGRRSRTRPARAGRVARRLGERSTSSRHRAPRMSRLVHECLPQQVRGVWCATTIGVGRISGAWVRARWTRCRGVTPRVRRTPPRPQGRQGRAPRYRRSGAGPHRRVGTPGSKRVG